RRSPDSTFPRMGRRAGSSRRLFIEAIYNSLGRIARIDSSKKLIWNSRTQGMRASPRIDPSVALAIL
ncbi:MAG: hypothetical protein NTW91_00365, partial [Verrucomicrobia bacterium]|nr:hypothetical protein [Verrucomicrobiota bacterium]